MKKGILTLLIILIILIVLAITGYIVYNYVPVKTLTFCISTNKVETTGVACRTDDECYSFMEDLVYEEIGLPPTKDDFGMPQEIDKDILFIYDYLSGLVKEITYCENYCFYKKVRGFGEDFGKIKECNEEEYAYKILLTPKQVVEVLKTVAIRKE